MCEYLKLLCKCRGEWSGMEEEKKRTKNPTLALILSAVFPGLGQLYNNQFPKGLILMALNIVINSLLFEPFERLISSRGSMPDNPTLIIVAGYTIAGLVLLVYSALDAKKTAERINKEEEMKNYEK
jgi:TM2 domain-containing membrane protein YozV